MNAKKLIVLIIITFFGIHADIFSQDLITLRNGDEVKAIVTEIDKNTVKYKKFENPTGPIYSLEKSGVFMIKYENGTKEVFEISVVEASKDEKGNVSAPAAAGLTYRKPGAILENNEYLSIDESRNILSRVPEALASYNKGLKLIKAGKLLNGIGLVTCLGIGLLVKDPSMTVLAVGVAVASTGLIGSISTTVSGRKKIKQAVNIYNLGGGRPE